jgi:HD-GYP domain-containing protein (c-di-GMP phosphodiesterase class II)
LRSESAAEVLKKIRVNELRVGMFVHGLDANWLKHPFWRSQFALTDPSRLRELQTSGIEHCWIDISKGVDLPVQQQAREPSGEVHTSKRVPGAQPEQHSLAEELKRAAQIRARSARTMRRLFAEARLGSAIEPGVCVELVDDIVESLDRHPDALLSLARLKNADEYTYVHSVAVCALMVALGRQLGLSDAQCREAGLAGMLHDLGKAVMPQDVLNKPGKLTPEEFEVIRQHPMRGYEMLLGGADVSEGMRDVCRHHHERVDGTGYPDRLAGDQISLLARMGAVCDVYDAVTSDRPYKAGWDPAYALSQMATWHGHFDPAVFQSFVKSVGIYPTGALVRLGSGRLAIVLDQNPAALTKPRVKVFFSTKSGMPLQPRILDLASSSVNDRIEAREPVENWDFPYLTDLWDASSALKQAR